MNKTNKLLFGTIPTTTKMWLIFEIDKGVLCRGKVSLQQKTQSSFRMSSSNFLEFGLNSNRWPNKTERTENWFTLLHVYKFASDNKSSVCCLFLAGSNVMNLLLFFFLEAMTHFSFGNLYMMNVWDTLCMYAHTRHRCRMNIFFVLMCLQFYSFEFCIINCHTFDRNVYSAFDSFFGVLLGFVINLYFCSNNFDQIRFHWNVTRKFNWFAINLN